MSCCLYKHYGQNGELLYVGISHDVWKRAVQHEGQSKWFSSVIRIDVEHFPNRDAAKEAEKAAVLSLKPQHNVDYLINAVLSLKERRMLVVGEQRMELLPTLVQAVAEHGLKVVACEAKVHAVTLHRFIDGSTAPTESTIRKLAEYFKAKQGTKEGK